jgi:hypothetical protein
MHMPFLSAADQNELTRMVWSVQEPAFVRMMADRAAEDIPRLATLQVSPPARVCRAPPPTLSRRRRTSVT